MLNCINYIQIQYIFFKKRSQTHFRPIFCYFSSCISTRIKSGPILLMQENGMIYSVPSPKKLHHFPPSGTTSASIQPLQSSMIRSSIYPSFLQSQQLITSFLDSSHSRILDICFPPPCRTQHNLSTL